MLYCYVVQTCLCCMRFVLFVVLPCSMNMFVLYDVLYACCILLTLYLFNFSFLLVWNYFWFNWNFWFACLYLIFSLPLVWNYIWFIWTFWFAGSLWLYWSISVLYFLSCILSVLDYIIWNLSLWHLLYPLFTDFSCFVFFYYFILLIENLTFVASVI